VNGIMSEVKEQAPGSKEKKFLADIQKSKAKCGLFLYGLCASRSSSGESVKIHEESRVQRSSNATLKYRLAVSKETKDAACNSYNSFMNGKSENVRPISHTLNNITDNHGNKCQLVQGDNYHGNYTVIGQPNDSGIKNGSDAFIFSDGDVGNYMRKTSDDLRETDRPQQPISPTVVRTESV
jgi:hypothetical protein